MTALPGLSELLGRHRRLLVRHFEKRGASLRRFESAEDLAQGVHLHAVRVEDRFEYQGEGPFVRWLLRLAKQHMADRVEYWTALKRDAGPMLRITYGASTTSGGVQPATPDSGPVTRASRHELLDVAARALDGLPPRDRAIVTLLSGGASIADIAAQLEVTQSAAQRARLRAIERFKKIYTIVSRR